MDLAPPPGVLGQITVGPLGPALARLNALGRILGAWDSEEDVFFPEIRALGEALSDLGPFLDWSRPAHFLFLDENLLRASYALALPVADPGKALEELATRCRGKQRDGAWTFDGGGEALLPCRFHARVVPGGLVVAPSALLVDALGRYAHALLDPRLRLPRATDRGASASLPTQQAVAALVVELKAFLPALRARFGIDSKKVGQWVDLAAMALAVASGDFTAAAGLKVEIQRLVTQIDSLEDVGLALELRDDALDLRLFATGRPGGALARWARDRRPASMGLHARVEPRAAFSLALVGPGGDLGPGRRSSVSKADHKAEGPGKGASAGARSPSALALLVDVLLARLPEPMRAPTRRLWNALTGPGSGELALGLRRSDEHGLALELLLEHGQPGRARRELLEGGLALLGALRERLGGSARLGLQAHRGQAVDRIDLLPGPGVLQTALQLLFGSSSLSLAVSHRGSTVGLVLGAKAEGRVEALLTTPPASGSSGGASYQAGPGPAVAQSPAMLPAPPPGTLGRVTMSLVELARLVPGLLDPQVTLPADAGALVLHWGVVPSRNRVELLVTLPAVHLKAAVPLLVALSDRAKGSAGSLTDLLGSDDDDEDDGDAL